MFNKTLELISATYTKDSIGQRIETPTYRKVYASYKSVPQSEFFAAGQTDIKPSACFLIRTGDYKGEKKLRYPAGDSGKIYAIYRFYDTKSEMTEVYCEQRVGDTK